MHVRAALTTFADNSAVRCIISKIADYSEQVKWLFWVLKMRIDI